MAKPTIQPDNTNLFGLSDKQTQVIGDIGQSLMRAPHYRTAYEINDRQSQVMTWRLPSGSSVQMYINPQNFTIRDSKQISETRTKGGFVVQYWGENLSQLTISGTTGSSGIRGINILRDIYRSEMRGFDLIAAQSMADIEEVKNGLSADANLSNLLDKTLETTQKRNFLMRPSLAALATNIILFYQGVEYKGFFKEMSVTESVQNLGLFDYNISFTATEVRGQRKNFMAWHKEPAADDAPGQLINAIGNSIRGVFGLTPQAPEIFHPATAPYTFSESSLAASLGFTGNNSLTEERTIFI